jgi:hypothetical protein
MYRRIFVALVRDSAIQNGMTSASFGEVAVRELVDQIHVLSTAPDDDEAEPEGDEDAGFRTGSPIDDEDALVLYDWYLNELPAAIRLEEVPQPGILIALVSSPEEALDAEGFRTLAMEVRLYLEKSGTKLGERIRNFMMSPDVGFVPVPLKRFDVFLSHDTSDVDDAIRIRDALSERTLSCFLASESLQVGSPWKEGLLDAIRNARVGVVLLTERSVTSQWVMCEVGALWGAGMPIIPVLKGVELEHVPDIVSSFQWYATTHWDAIDALVDRVHQLCREPQG